MINKLIIIFLLSLIGCNKNNKPSQHNPIHTEEIRSLEVVNFGGKFGVHSSTLINHDSVHFRHKINRESHNLEFSRKIKPEDWKNLVAEINLNDFRNMKEGKSMQPIDGIDSKIVMITNTDTISKMNGYDHPVWENILNHVFRFNKE